MAKNLKLNIKNTQLAQALNLNGLKRKLGDKLAPKAPVKEEIPETVTPPKAVVEVVPSQGEQKPEIERSAEAVKPLTPPSGGYLRRPLPFERAKRSLFPEKEVTRALDAELSEEEGGEEEVRKIKARDKSSLVVPPRAPQRMSLPSERHGGRKPLPFATDWKLKSAHVPTSPSPESSVRPKLGFTGRHVDDLKPKPISRPPTGSRPAIEGRAPYGERPLGGQDRPRRPGGFRPGEGRGLDARQVPLPPKEGALDQRRKSLQPSGEEAAAGPKKAFKLKDASDKGVKKGSLKGFDGRDRQGLRDDGDGEKWRKRRLPKMEGAREALTIRPAELKVRLPISIKDLAAEMKLKASQLIGKLFLQGVVATLNDFLEDVTTIQLLGHEFGCAITIDTSQEERIRITAETIQEEIQSTDSALLVLRPPVVAFMGHVDHGKTSLIDAIRKSQRVLQEAGAITQHIGAFCCQTAVGPLTILDTPGHEAFSAMRTRGAQATDIVVLVIAGDEGVKQQTIEAIQQAKAAGVTIVVALNKCDKPDFNPDMVYQQLATQELLPEAWGGATVTVNCSALTGVGVPELLEMLALQAEVLELKADPQARARGLVLESQMHKGLGVVATLLVKNGTLHLGDPLVFDEYWGRVRTMRDERGRDLKEAGPSSAVEVTGLSGLPEAGHEFIVVANEREAKEISEKRQEELRQRFLQQKKKLSVEHLMLQAAAVQKKVANCILRADVQGSLEAIKSSLSNIKSDKIELNIVSADVGEVSESDVQLAVASNAFIVGFHTQVESHAEELIKQTGVKVRLHDIIYHAIDDVKKVLVEMLDKTPEERILGQASIQAIFRSSQLGLIAGCIVNEGAVARGNRIRVLRQGKVLWTGGIASLKRLKEDVREVKKGLECGIVLDGYQDVEVGDLLQAFEIYYLAQEL